MAAAHRSAVIPWTLLVLVVVLAAAVVGTLLLLRRTRARRKDREDTTSERQAPLGRSQVLGKGSPRRLSRPKQALTREPTMTRFTAKLARFVAVAAVAVVATLTAGATAAHADDTVRSTMQISVVTVGSLQSPCSSGAVWGVVVGEGSPAYTWGNYQVCWYPRSVVGSGMDFSDFADGASLLAEFRRQAPETGSADLVSYCVYRMPAGPNRTATITYRTKLYTVVVTDTYADGHKVVHPAQTGTYFVQPTVAWNPGCWT
jgi:hypothetical protein